VAPIGELVTTYFDGPFEPESSAEQAAFAPLITVHEATADDGVRWCGVTPDQNYPNRIIAADAKQVAAWIATRIAAEDRNAEDFLVLTRGRKALEHYARAIAEQGVPVTTSGATLPQEHELQELVVVLRALADPDNPVHVAAALEGLFFGLSPADLYEAREAGLHFRITYAPAGESGAAGALRTLHEWWRRSQRDPADVLLAHLLDDTGLLPYAASQPLGDNRGGALLHLVEAVRGTATDPAPDLRSAIAVVERLLLGEAPDALLLPGRGRAVRVMNLHKAKGRGWSTRTSRDPPRTSRPGARSAACSIRWRRSSRSCCAIRRDAWCRPSRWRTSMSVGAASCSSGRRLSRQGGSIAP